MTTTHEQRAALRQAQADRRQARNRRGQAAWRARQKVAQQEAATLRVNVKTLLERLEAVERDLASARAALAADNSGTTAGDVIAFLDAAPTLREEVRARLILT
jgi:chromosome segregation ATPase